MLPCPQSIYRSILGPLANWCLDTFAADAPMLVGVELGEDTFGLHPVHLDEADPLRDLAELVAPDDWDAAVVVLAAQDAHGGRMSGTLAHAVDRHGQSATYLDEDCGRRRPLYHARGRLHDRCHMLFGWIDR